MIDRLIQLTGAMLVAAALSSLPLLAASEAQDQIPNMTGVWELNADASENPSGEAKPNDCARGGGRGSDRSRVAAGRGGLGGGGDTGGGTVMYGGGAGDATFSASASQ